MLRKKAFITGASEGLGRTFAIKLAQEGYDTTSVARNESRLKELMTELGNGDHDYIIADLSQNSGIERCHNRLKEIKYDLLINNAGFGRFGLFGDADIEEEQKNMRVNCDALVILSHSFLNKAVSGDALINLSSITNYLPTPIQPIYCATKAFIASFSESLWYQERERGVYVQGLCPGITKTQFIDRAAGEFCQKKLLDMISQTPEEVINISLDALKQRKKPIVIPRIRNCMIAAFSTMMPRKLLVWMSGKICDLA